MIEIFKNKNYTKLFAAAITSEMGTTVGNMTFAFYLADHFSSQPYWISLAELMYSLPTLFVFLFIGVIADRFDRQKIAEYSDWIRAVLTLFLIASIPMHIIPLTLGILFLQSAVHKFFHPAQSGLIQGILKKEQYQTAFGLNRMIFGVFLIFSVGLGAITYNTVGIYGAFMIDGISFVISALMIRSCKINKAVRLPNGHFKIKEIKLKQTWIDFQNGATYVLKNKLLLFLVAGFFMFGLINGAFYVVSLLTMKYKLDLVNYEWYAALFTMLLGIGIFAGSALASTIGTKFKPYLLIIVCSLITGFLAFIGGVSTSVTPYMIVAPILGLFLAPIWVAIGGWIPRIVAPSYIGRVNGLIDPIMMLAQSISLGLIAVSFPAFISVDFIYYGMALLLSSVGVLYMLTLPKLAKVETAKELTNESGTKVEA
ncbi:MFS transporter [Longirhabdus pacifica]|uniref:MFS transporter n=1 Tax=Longirhabdus pacifica TaxID=2305227 RepID=UPI0013E8EB06|nr:MFS transporter [Longirhabdus pacifica]